MFFRNLSLALVLSLGIMGYPLLASLMSLLEAGDSSLPSVVFRISLAVLAVSALVLNRKILRFYSPIFQLAALVFWSAYMMRIFYDGYIMQDFSENYEPLVIVVTAFTFVFIPMLASFVGLSERNHRIAFLLLLVFTVFTTLLMMIDVRELIFTIVDKNRVRVELEKLNPIAVGYVGGVLLILSAINLLQSLLRLRVVNASTG